MDDQLLDRVSEVKCSEEGDQLQCTVGSGPSVWNEMEEDIDFMEGKEEVRVDRVDLEGGFTERSAMSATDTGFHVTDMGAATCFIEKGEYMGNTSLECYQA